MGCVAAGCARRVIHRLDKDTSGLLVVARTPRRSIIVATDHGAHNVARLPAVCVGVMTGGGTHRCPIGRQMQRWLRVAVREAGGRRVNAHRVWSAFCATYCRCRLETGNYQIRSICPSKSTIGGVRLRHGQDLAQARGAAGKGHTMRALSGKALPAASLG